MMMEIEINEVKHLLEQTAMIDKKHKDIARIRGADYNIFDVLRIHKKEVTLHSRMIKDLLNPKGKHAQGNIFLGLFLEMLKSKIVFSKSEQLNENEIQDFKANNNTESNKFLIDNFTKDSFIYINDEEPLGLINKEYETGGSIDIFLRTNENTHLVIENKIDHNDENQQLIRYSNSIHNSFIIYLTKNGKIPDEISTKSSKKAYKPKKLEENKGFFCISYREDILNWLEECKSEVSNLPHLREMLSQYIYTVKRITNQNPNEMNKELAKLIFENKMNKNKLSYEALITKLNATLTSPEYYNLYNVEYGQKIINLFEKLTSTIPNLIDRRGNLDDLAVYENSKTAVLFDYKENENDYFYSTFKFYCKIGYTDFRSSIRAKNDEIALKYNSLLSSKINFEHINKEVVVMGSKSFSTTKVEADFLNNLTNDSFYEEFKKELKILKDVCKGVNDEIKEIKKN